MRKAVQLKVNLWVEGEAAPKDDFAALAMLAVHEIIAAGQSLHPELKISIRRVTEHSSDDEESDQAEESADRF
ncbi:MAG: hypothetical protein U0Z53_28595 [Blastocatellia bacterium]